MLAESAAAALMFQDETAAQELLQTLRNAPNVHVAALYTQQRHLFASYRSEAQVHPCLRRLMPRPPASRSR
jgi:uncharacterized membrane protein affecting hemolysin expression